MVFRFFFIFFFAMAFSAQAKDFFVDSAAKGQGSGSEQAPFKSIKDAFASQSISGGDRVIVSRGNYGKLVLQNLRFTKPVEIIAADGAEVHFESINILKSSHLTLRGFQVWPSNPKPTHASLVQSSGDSSDILFDRFDVRAVKDAGKYMSWSKAQWRKLKVSGVLIRGRRNGVTNSQVLGAYMGIAAMGSQARIVNNKIIGFSGDAMRSLGDNSLVGENFVQDCFQIDGNHADGFQSWSVGKDRKPGTGTVSGLTIEKNFFFEWNGKANHPLRCSLQGIGLFDGMFKDLRIENNVVSVTAYHGITVSGALNTSIINNTVVNAKGPSRDSPWIGVFFHKNGTRPDQVLVANNVAMAYRLPRFIEKNAKNNLTIFSPAKYLTAPFKGDFRPRNGSGLIDRADSRLAPQTDILGTPRPMGARADVGAFEVQ